MCYHMDNIFPVYGILGYRLQPYNIQTLIQDINHQKEVHACFWKSSSSCKFKFNRTRWFFWSSYVFYEEEKRSFDKDNSCLRSEACNERRMHWYSFFCLTRLLLFNFHIWLFSFWKKCVQKYSSIWTSLWG